jgi:hypothetical protein
MSFSTSWAEAASLRAGANRSPRRGHAAPIAEREFAADTPLWVLAFHSGDEGGARRVLEAVRSVRRIVREEVIPLTPALGAQTGPGITGFAALPVSP